MRTKSYIIIKFDDLSSSKQQEVKEHIKKVYRDTLTVKEVIEILTDNPEVHNFEDLLLRVDDQVSCAWSEMEIITNLRRS